MIKLLFVNSSFSNFMSNYRFMKPVFFCLLFLIFACTSNVDSSGKNPAPNPDTARHYFPVMDFLKSEIAYVDSLPGGIKIFRTMNTTTDSSYIEASVFDHYAREFIAKDIDSAGLASGYQEQSFFDNTTNASTFIYTAQGDEKEVRQIHVLAKPDAAYDRVISIYMEKFTRTPDSTFLKKMTWKPGKEFTINQSVQGADANPSISQIRIVWDNWEPEQ